MKRLALLTITACLAVVLSACGQSAEKKEENGATSTVQSQDTGNGNNAGAPDDTTKTGQ